MKRSWLITIAACILLTGMGVAVVTVPRVIPRAKCSAVYQRYVDVDGVDAAFLKDYQVNDTMAIDVTMLKATDSASWAMLQKDFNVPPMAPIVIEYINKGVDVVTSKLVDKNDYTKSLTKDSPDCEIIAITHAEHAIYVFHTNNAKEIQAILYRNIDKTTKY